MPARKTKYQLSVGLFLTLLIFSCQDKNEKAVILLSPLDLYISANSSEVVVIDVACHSPFELKQLTIKSRLPGEFALTELDSILSGKDVSFQYEYRVPGETESTTITLEFTLLDESGGKATNFKIIEIITNTIFLTETAGHEMFSGSSGKQNAYNLVAGTPQYLHLADSSDMHIADTTNSEILLNRWVSPSGAKFVKFNGFDYANATAQSTKAAYTAGIRNDFVNMVAIGDIYITKIRTRDLKEVYPAIKITGIIDEPGSESDRYVFNIKK